MNLSNVFIQSILRRIDPARARLFLVIEWIAQPAPAEQRRLLEKHRELLQPIIPKILKLLPAVFDEQREDFQRMTGVSEGRLEEQFQKYKRILRLIFTNAGAEDSLARGHAICETALELLETIHEHGASMEAIRTAYVEHFGGFALDMPGWLEKSLVEIVDRYEDCPELAKQEAEEWYRLIVRAQKGNRIPREIVAELWYARAKALLKDTATDDPGNIEQVIAAFEAALEVFPSGRYPRQNARFQAHLVEARAYRDQELTIESAIRIGQEILSILSAADKSVEDTVGARLNTGMHHLLRAEAEGTVADCEQAIECFEAVLSVSDRETTPEQWASAQTLLAMTYQQLVDLRRSIEASERALTCFEASSRVFTREAYPVQWATIQFYYGFVRTRRIEIGKIEEQVQALGHFMQALEVFTRDDFPMWWAKVQRQLGGLCAASPQTGHIEQAQHYYEAALEIFTPEKYPIDRAKCYNDLGALYTNYGVEQNEEERWEQAIRYYEAAFQLYERQAKRTREWAMVQMSLGTAYQERIKGDKNENIRRAIACHKNALQFFDQRVPSPDWADAKYALAQAYSDMHLQGDDATDTERAIAACEAALEVFTRNEFPEKWAVAQQRLGRLYSHREEGDRASNQEKAIHCLQAALQVFTCDKYPQDWAAMQIFLGLTYSDRIWGDKDENIEQAIKCHEAALEVYTSTDISPNWMVAQSSLAGLYNERIWGDERDNQEMAFCLCQEVLSKLSPDRDFEVWLPAQGLLGRIYRERLIGDPDENLARAAECYESVLRSISIETYPEIYHITQIVLAQIHARQEDWQAVDKAYEEALQAEDRLILMRAGVAGKHKAIGQGIEIRDRGARQGFALIRLGELEKGIVAIERGQARIMTASLAIDTADPTQIKDPERRQRFIQARQAHVEAGIELNKPLSSDFLENDRRKLEIERRDRFHVAQNTLYAVFDDIRTAHDPDNFTDDAPDIQMIFKAAARGGPGHALVYLMATPWGGMAVAAFNANPEQGTQTRIATLVLPGLRDDTIVHLMGVGLKQRGTPIIGGYYYAQDHLGYTLLLQDWRGVSFQGYAEDLNDACFREEKEGLLDRAAQDVLADAEVAHLVGQPLKSLEKDSKSKSLLEGKFNDRFLKLEIQRVLDTLSQTEIPTMVDWLVAQGAKSLTLVPCGPLAALPITAVRCAKGLTLAEILPTSVAPNARSLIQQNIVREEERSGVYALGDPGSKYQQSLLWANAQTLSTVKLAQKLKERGEQAVGADANYKWLVDALQKAHVVVASCHGRYDRDDFLLTRLLLANNQKLTLGDMLSYKVDERGLRLLDGLRLFALPACQTAVAEMQGGEANEVKSLATGVLQAGAEAVLATLWPVDDRATYLLMVRFAQEWLPQMKSEPPAAALGCVQHWLRTVTNGQLRSWEANELLSTTSEEKQATKEKTRRYRPDMLDGEQLIRSEAQKGKPNEQPFADPVYWAGFQVTGW